MLSAPCHGGAVRAEIPRGPRSVTNRHCAISRRYGVLWAHQRDSEVRPVAEPGSIDEHSWGCKGQEFMRCIGASGQVP